MSYRKMPHNNRLSGSAALRTNDMWSKTIGHDPYANQQVDTIDQMSQSNMASQSASLLLLAKMSNLSGMESRGGCTKCGALGHLTFQCRNKVSTIIANNDNDSSSTSSSDDEGNDNNNIDIKNKQNVPSTQLLNVGSSKIQLNNTSSTKKRNRSNSEASNEEHKKSAKHKKHKHNKDTKKSKNSKKSKKTKKAKHN